MKIPAQYIFKGQSQNYPKQEWIKHCGLFCAVHVLKSLGVEVKEQHPRSFHRSWVRKLLGQTLGSLIEFTLHTHGVEVHAGNMRNKTYDERLSFLKSEISKNRPVILHVGDGYKFNQYHISRAYLVSHWIVIYGYDDKEQVFYIYDSCVNKPDTKIPIGNVARYYREIIRDWGRGAIPGCEFYKYISVSK